MTSILEHYSLKMMNLSKIFLTFKKNLEKKLKFWRKLTSNQKISLIFFLFFILIIPLSVLAVLTPVKLRQKAQVPLPATPPVIITPTLAPTISPIQVGAYSLRLTNYQTEITCKLGDPNCYYQTTLIATNRTGKPLYNTTMYQSSPNNIMSFIGFDGNWTSQKSTTTKIVQPWEEAVNTLVKVVPPKILGKTNSTFYIDGQTCNINVSPPDCYFYGASSLTVTINVVESLTPTTHPLSPSPQLTPPLTPSPAVLNPIKWNTPQVYLQADDFYLVANGKKFFAKVPNVRVSSDPGNPTYTTLEVQWQENGQEMRLYMYFHADNQKWWSPEIRTYGGYPPENWIYYYGRFFESPLGSEYKDNFVLMYSDSQRNKGNSGNIYFKNLRLQAFKNRLVTPTLAPRPTTWFTPSPHPILTPTPTVSLNHLPVITTISLPIGRVGKTYTATISGYDLDLDNILTMTITNLPPGIPKGPCKTSIVQRRKQISCLISGKPTKSGIYSIGLTLKDNRGGVARRTLSLRIYRLLPFF